MTILNRFTNNSVKTLADAPIITLDAEDAPHYQVTITANRTLGNPTSPTLAKEMWIAISQDGAGNHTLAFQSDWVAIDANTSVNPAPNSISVLHASARNFGAGIKWYYSIDSTTSGIGTITLGGDVTGASSANLVTRIQSVPVPVPTAGVLTYNAGALSWAAVSGGTGTGVTYPTSAALSAKTGAVDNELAITQGSVSPNDTGGGAFYFKLGSAVTANGATVLTGVGGRWFRVLQDNMLNVRWFGAVGDGTADDTVAIQTAINNCTSNAGGVYFPRGTYRITKSLTCGWYTKISTDPAPPVYLGNNIHAIRFVGENLSTSPLEGGTILVWDSAVTDEGLFWISGYNYHFQGLEIRAASGRTLHAGFDLSNLGPGGGEQFKSSCTWLSCSVRGEIPGTTISYGIAFGYKFIASGYNIENCKIQDCTFRDCKIAGLAIYSGQPYNTHVDGCYFWTSTSSVPAGYGVFVQGVNGSGSVRVTNTDFQNIEVVYYVNGTNMTAHFEGGEYEHCKKLYLAAFFGSSTELSTASFRNARCNNSSVTAVTANFGADDYRVFRVIGSGSVLTIDNIVMDDHSFPVECEITYGNTLISTGNVWSYNYPFKVTNTGDGGLRVGGVYSIGDRNMTNPEVPGSQTYPMASQYGGINPSGLASIANQNPYASVSLPFNEYKNDFNIRLELDSYTGTPNPGAFVPYVQAGTKQPFGFTFFVTAAPGDGNTVTYRWTTYR